MHLNLSCPAVSHLQIYHIYHIISYLSVYMIILYAYIINVYKCHLYISFLYIYIYTLHLQVERNAKDVESLHFEIHTNSSLIIIIKELVTEPE